MWVEKGPRVDGERLALSIIGRYEIESGWMVIRTRGGILEGFWRGREIFGLLN